MQTTDNIAPAATHIPCDICNQPNVNPTQLYITCERSEGLLLVELGLMAGRLAGRQLIRQIKFGQGLVF